jgi:hypothetical protein
MKSNRRDFIKVAGLAGAGLMVLPNMFLIGLHGPIRLIFSIRDIIM